MTPEELDKLIADYVTKISEHTNSVQIMAEWNEQGITKSIFRGAGSWYARKGLMLEFQEQDVARTNAHEIRNSIHPLGSDLPPEEDWGSPNFPG